MNKNDKNFIDIKMAFDENKGYYDIIPTEEGDLAYDDSFDTTVKCSLLTDGRADSSEVKYVEKQRGTIVDLFTTARNGSKLWLLEQARLDLNSKNKAIDYAKTALKFMLDANYIKNVLITGRLTANGITLNIDFERLSGVFDKYRYDAWENSVYKTN